MSRYTFISSDCHAAPKMPDYRPYVAAAHRESFDDWLAESQRQAAEARRSRIGGNLFDEDYIEEAEKNDAFAASHMDGLWSHETRVNDLEADGVVAEVIFPNGIPFTPLRGGEVSREARLEGTRAYNRWLSDFCQQAPGRRGGIAVLDLHDIDAAVTEIRSAREAGLFAGVLLPPAGCTDGRVNPTLAMTAPLPPSGLVPPPPERDASALMPGVGEASCPEAGFGAAHHETNTCIANHDWSPPYSTVFQLSLTESNRAHRGLTLIGQCGNLRHFDLVLPGLSQNI